MNNDNSKEGIEKKFAKQELLSIIILTVILLIAWAFSSDLVKYIPPDFKNQYMYGALLLALFITVTSMRIFGLAFIKFIIGKIWKKQSHKK